MIFNNDRITDLWPLAKFIGEKVLKIGQHLKLVQAKNTVGPFSAHLRPAVARILGATLYLPRIMQARYLVPQLIRGCHCLPVCLNHF